MAISLINMPSKRKSISWKGAVLFLLVLTALGMLFYINHLKSSNAPRAGAKRISGTMCEIICPAGWEYELFDNSYFFSFTDGSSIILDIWEHERNIFSPLDLNPMQIQMLLESMLLKYGKESKQISILEIGQGKFAGLHCINFDYETFPGAKNGTGMIFFSREQRFVYAATCMTPGDSRQKRVCLLMKNYIELKDPWNIPLYQRPFIDSLAYSEQSEALRKTELYYSQALELWQNSKDNPNNILNSMKAFQAALEELSKTNTGGCIYAKRQQLVEDYKTVQKARMDMIVKMKSQITQYIKLNNTDTAKQLLGDLLSTASLENEISIKEWALKTMGTLKNTGE
ncbi:MAG TPA: hypothetical protein DCZ94_08105 [Lentisphaeria bacterium]|nr:MAG: hypothetical protein A2X48_19580 [Lentisphaerae bacterium GWF2_49_21]HBC86901.1 hypothetical protein [Lentisphaeria bacterium]